ncbi:hypothetical protein Pmani_004490 [Petrolisthes manimaculis]|uniref:Uncharacterized protein n=1 Tax=Petrolisthes manimaculis TaxID=1843537 RepID=A0AAE1UNY6_9EUCA|nr:hypothetical protein Pmani_004490 [Petrolisthes manimaculis]
MIDQVEESHLMCSIYIKEDRKPVRSSPCGNITAPMGWVSVYTTRCEEGSDIQTLVSASAVTPCATNTTRKLAGAATVTVKAQTLSAAFLKPSHLSL